MHGELDFKALSFYLQFANSLGVIVAFLYTWLSNRHKATAAAINSLKDSVLEDRSTIESRFARVEAEIRHLPTHHDMGVMYERINSVAETLSLIQGEIKQMNAGLKLVHTHLLSQKGG